MTAKYSKVDIASRNIAVNICNALPNSTKKYKRKEIKKHLKFTLKKMRVPNQLILEMIGIYTDI